MAIVGWICTRCKHRMWHNFRACPVCNYTVFKPVHGERPAEQSGGGARV